MDDLEKVIAFAIKDGKYRFGSGDISKVIAQAVRGWMRKEEDKRNYIRLDCDCLMEVEPDE